MLAVLASRLDAAARDLVSSWSSADAALLSAEDLSREGWLFRVSDPASGTAVVDGRRVAVDEVEAVVTRRPAVLAEELAWIDAGDREYMAAEANAFLVAWLSALSVPVVNRPTATSLCGPAWGPHHWAAAASRAGVGWGGSSDGEGHDVVLAGGRCIGVRGPAEEQAVQALAAEAGVELLGVRFAGGNAVAATTLPSLDGDAKDALLEHVLRR